MNAEQRSKIVEHILSELSERGITTTDRPGPDSEHTHPSNLPEPDTCSLSDSSPDYSEPDPGQVLTEDDVEHFHRESDDHTYRIPSDTIVTPLAQDRAEDLDVTIQSI